jgi:hypothetical protein
LDRSRRRGQTPRDEELNHERPDDKGLPVIPTEDGAEPRKTSHRGIRGSFYVLPPEIAGRKARGNYARAGARDIRSEARRVTPSSDVSGREEAIANLGRAVAAGVVAGARRGSAA